MESEEFELMAAAEDHMWWFRGLHAWLIDRILAIRFPAGATLLDCGSGTGGFAKRLLAQIPHAEVTGVDIDGTAVQIYAEKTRRPVVRGSVNELAFSPDQFDLIVSSDVLCHRAVNETAAISELRRCLKPGGILLLNLPAYNWMKASHDVHVHTERRYTAGEAARKLRTAGFTIREATYRNSLLFPVMAFWRLTFGRFASKSDVDDFPAWQEMLFGKVIAFENTLARRGIRFPFGGSVYVHAVKD